MKLQPIIKTLQRVIQQNHSLNDSFYDIPLDAEQKAVCYGVIRWYLQLEAYAEELLHEPLKGKNFPVLLHIYIGIFQIRYGHKPDFAAVKEIVGSIKESKFRWAAALVNKVLRRFIEEQPQISAKLEKSMVAHYAHPWWMIKKLDKDTKLLEANNAQAPMTLRVNQQQITRHDYLKQLEQAGFEGIELTSSPTAIQLKQPAAVDKLPGFNKGLCSVQDEAGQRLIDFLELKPGLRILDACCAPGSKTCHILEAQPDIGALTAIDVDPKRLKKVAENLQRLQLNQQVTQLLAADANDIDSWWDKQPFDRILVDAPCSASGVIRRHPDIKLLRRETDIAELAQRQLALLTTLSELISDDGILIYSTCSVFTDENQAVIEQFCEQQPFKLVKDLQLYPTIDGHDGFYMAQLTRK